MCMQCGNKKDLAYTLKCTHSFCVKCILDKIKENYEASGSSPYFRLKCLMPHCFYLPTEEEIKNAIPPKEFKEFFSLENAKNPRKPCCLFCSITNADYLVKTSDKCKHLICKKCIVEYAEEETAGEIAVYINIEKSEMSSIACPMPGCKERINVKEIIPYFDEEWKNSLLKNAEEKYIELHPEGAKEDKELRNKEDEGTLK